MKNIKIFAFLAVFLLSAAVSTAWAVDVTLTYKIDVQGALKPVAKIYDATNRLVASWDHGIMTLWPANEGHTMDDGYGITFTPDQELDKTGTNENNESASTTAFRTEKTTFFTVSVGKEGFYLKSVTFKEDNTVKESSSNIAPNSTSVSVRVSGDKFFNYITVVLTVDAYTVSVPENLTISDAFATINRVKYYKSGETVTLTAKENEIINTITGVTASNENVTINLAADRKTATFKMPSEDVTITATTTEVHTVSVPDGITLSDAFINISGTDYYKKGQTVTFGFSGSGSVVYFVNGERIEGNSVTVGQEDLTVQIGIPYIDENGKTQIREPGEYTVLTSLTDVSNLGGGWYVVQGKVEYTSQVKFSGDAHLILADGAEMTIESKTYGIQADTNLTIYGQNGQSDQSDQSGTLKVTATGLYGINSEKGNITISGGSVTASGSNYGIYGSEGVTINGGIVTASSSNYGIYGSEGVTINGGIVTATGTRGLGIYGSNGVTINGGIVTATGYNSIYNDYGNITISGGSVTATGTRNGLYGHNGVTINGGSVTATGTNGYGIYSQNRDITLGWTNSTDFIKASSYKGSVQIAEGKSFKDENGNVYRGTLSSSQLDIIKKKTLEPCYAVTLNLQDGNDPVVVAATFDENGVAYVAKPADPTRDGFTFEGWFAAPEGGSEFDWTAAVTQDTTIYAKWGVPYIDEKGAPKSVTDYTVLTSSTDVSNLSGGWYVVQGKVEYSNQVTFNGDAHLILADGAEMEIESKTYGIQADKNLTIYGQNEQRGILNATSTLSSDSGQTYDAIYSDGNITIIGGSVTATSEYGDGIVSSSGDITISGGRVTATGNYNGIYNDKGNITLGWTNSTDFIKVSSIHLGVDSCTVSIAEGKSFKDENGIVYSGTLTGEQLSAIEGEKLEPCYAVTFDAQNGDDPIMLLTTFDENGVAYVAKPADPTRDGFSFEGWFTTTDGNTEFDFSAAITGNTTAYAHWNENTPVKYIDENGGTNETKNYILLTNDINVDNLPGGWYVVQGKVEYTSQVKFSGDAHLILADGAEMTIESKTYGIQADKNLTIYGQNEQRGILNATSTLSSDSGQTYDAIYSDGNITIIGGSVTATSKDGYGIYSYSGDITIIGGTVEATGDYGIYSDGTIEISGGTVEATGNKYGIYSYNGGVTISGGSVTATSKYGYGIYSNSGNITLDWTNSTDFIKVSSIYLGVDSCTVSIAEGKYFTDEEGNVYSRTLDKKQIVDIAGQKLTPVMPFPENMVVADISDTTYVGDSIRVEPDVLIGKNVLELGKDYTLAYEDNLNASEAAKVIVKGAGIYFGEVSKTFTIDKAPLKITALNDTITYGDEAPIAGEVEYSGFVNGENEKSLNGTLVYSNAYTQYGKVGDYAISLSGLTADNYDITFVEGKLTVGKKFLSVEWEEQTEFTYDGKEHVPTVTAEGFVEGYEAALVVMGAAKNVGTHTATVALDENDANSVNYKLPGKGLEREFKIVKLLSDESIVVANIPVHNYKDGEPVCPKSIVVTDGKKTLKAGTDYTFECFNNTDLTSGTLDENAPYVKITGIGDSYAGEIEKRFFIWKNIGYYAAVQVFEDADGKPHAEIDGAYDGTDAVAFDEDISVESVVFNREFSVNLENGGFSTIMLPFDVNANNLTGVRSIVEFDGLVEENGQSAVGMAYVWCNHELGVKRMESGHQNCSEFSGELKAYTPYMIEMESATLGINGGVTLKSTVTVTPEARVDDWVFRGTLAMHEWTSEEMKNTKIWGFAAQQQGDFKIGEFVPFGAGAWIRPFRAFMEYDPDGNNGSSGAPVPKGELGPTVASIDLPETMEVVIVSREGGEEHTTVIGRLNTRTGEIRLNSEGRRTFDLKGRSVGKPKAKGIYLKK